MFVNCQRESFSKIHLSILFATRLFIFLAGSRADLVWLADETILLEKRGRHASSSNEV